MVSNEPILRFFNLHHPNKTKPYSIKYRNKYINLINNQIMLSDSQIEKNKQEYLRLLGTVKREGIDKLIEWLTDTNSCDFFTAPSSSVYHGNYKGGLCEHSLNVYKCLIKLRDMYDKMMPEFGKTPVKYSDEQCIIVALLHDLCKVLYYVPTEKFYKDDYNQWQKYIGYTVKDQFPFGHGEKSCFLIQRFMMLTGVEALAIRWHMGYEKSGLHIDSTEKKSIGDAWNIAPLAYLLHQADSMSAFLIEDMIEPKNANRNI